MHPIATIPASEKIGSFLLWNWLIDRSPGWAFLIMLFIAPVFIMFVIRPGVEGRMIRLQDEFLTHKLDVMLAPAFGIGLVLVGAMGNHQYVGRTVLRFIVQMIIVLSWVGFAWWHMQQESEFYTCKQRRTPSAIYHNFFLYTFAGYALTMVCGMGLFFAPWSFQYIVLRLAMLACLGSWFLAWPLWDAKHKNNPEGVSKFKLAHPLDGGWPTLDHHYQNLRGDWSAYWADIKSLPFRLATHLRKLFS
jgi:hypothetical protein